MTDVVRKKKSNQASLLGILTSIVIALQVVDVDKLNWHLPSTYILLGTILLPAIGGAASQIK